MRKNARGGLSFREEAAMSAAEYRIAAPDAADVVPLITLMNALAAERNGLFILPVDPVTGVAQLTAYLAEAAASGNEAVLLAKLGREVVGLASGTRGTHPARRRNIDLGVGVGAAWRGRGIGTALLRAMEDWAESAGIRRLQLTVVTANAPAVALYRRLGFAIEGVLASHAERDGIRFDEFVMAKILARAEAEGMRHIAEEHPAVKR
jgi:RimJ/RimL family protein N-acetyltransferase